MVQKKQRKEGEGGEEKHVQRARGPELEPGNYRVLGEGPQLHATGVA